MAGPALFERWSLGLRQAGQCVLAGVSSTCAAAQAHPLSRRSTHARVGDDGAKDIVSGVSSPAWPDAWGLATEGFDMTQNRRAKHAIRSRMGQTGEKYTEARRALLPRAVTAAALTKIPAPRSHGRRRWAGLPTRHTTRSCSPMTR